MSKLHSTNIGWFCSHHLHSLPSSSPNSQTPLCGSSLFTYSISLFLTRPRFPTLLSSLILASLTPLLSSPIFVPLLSSLLFNPCPSYTSPALDRSLSLLSSLTLLAPLLALLTHSDSSPTPLYSTLLCLLSNFLCIPVTIIPPPYDIHAHPYAFPIYLSVCLSLPHSSFSTQLSYY
ncbi:hypothetical protein Pcinc_041013 [Petrolisthes cinctipes]|uniref:Uncharacterized protein n=1 Tax=Petrolisthes cinctipes TaxID=88211 RepID=A0AAE1EK88_PETCI|nr:hypothetical protein Pcinc_041013 [Petrolisthes cinctipes]